jgi:hypothetical protein
MAVHRGFASEMLNHHRTAVLTALAFTLTGAACICLRMKYAHRPFLPRGNSSWRLTYDISFPNIKKGKIYIVIPDNTPQSRVLHESFSHQGIWMDILRSKKGLAREAVVVPMVGHEQGRFTAQFDVRLIPERESRASASSKLTAEETAHYLREEKAIQLRSQPILDIMNRLTETQTTKTKLLQAIFEYCSESIVQGDQNAPSDAARTLQQGVGTTLGRTAAMVALCRAAKIPARLVTGFFLKPNPDARPNYWVEVFWKKGWLPYDPENGYSGKLPATYLAVRRDGTEIIRSSGSLNYESKYSIRHLLPRPTSTGLPDNQIWSVVDLTRLPPSMQQTITLILLLPVGALITAIFRNIVGIQTFGTFTPTLIAFSFVHADWRTGAVVFFIVLTTGMLARLLLSKLRLLLVARLGIILTLVVLCMILAVSMLDYLGLTPSARAVLLPMVILTWVIERFDITADEDGYPQALKMFAGTLAVAVCCLLVLRLEGIGRLVLGFPEVHLFTAAVLLWVGRYSGYRLTELSRFRDIAKS